ncbi:leucine-rich repeat domain-containing protein [Telluribacter sp. SYSU D00476]|uniref:leucine-rich repeat domain-containing protein n=1 Tax=Telluribacter sp. SYSU D00476 TaxID=2811430 RepID=UPI001FF61120|nr:leucine-rich repeat domain-containing protein [Telluribacter sp. SYSU D00476]
MKTLLIILLALTLGYSASVAQTRVVSREEAGQLKIDENELGQKYPPYWLNERGMGAINGFQNEIVKLFKGTPNPGFYLMGALYVSETGKIDYLIYQIISDHPARDSLRKAVKIKLTGGLADWELENSKKQPYRLGYSIAIGTLPDKRLNTVPNWNARRVRKGDSTLTTLPEATAMVDTARVKRLFLNQLDLKEVPSVIYRFPNLEELDLHGNNLSAAHIDVARLPRLKKLDLRENQLTNESLTITRNKTIQILNIQWNKFMDIPEAVRACTRLSSLWLGRNQLTELSDRSFRRLRHLHDLNLYQSGLTTLPRGIRKMRRLEVIDLYYNKLTELPASITSLRKLNHLAVSHNQLTELPRRMDRLRDLQVMYAHHNRLSSLPDPFGRLSRLRLVDLGYNWYTTFPPEIRQLTKLKELDISENNLAEFPEALLEMKQLEKLYLRGNPFLKKGPDKKYGLLLDQMKTNATEVYY